MKKSFILLVLLGLVFSCTKDPVVVKENLEMDLCLIGKSDTTSFSVRIKPDGSSTRYEYAIGTENDYASFENGTMASLVSVDGCDSADVLFDGLEPDKVYTVFARSYSGDFAGGIAELKVKTGKDEFLAETRYVHKTSAGFRIKTSSNYPYFRYYLGTQEDGEDFRNGTIEGETISGITDVKSVNYFDLASGSYVFYAVAYDMLGFPSDLVSIPVEIDQDAQLPDASFEKVSLDLYRGVYRLVPNEQCAKISCVFGFDGENMNILNNNFKGDVIDWIMNWEEIPDMVKSFSSVGKDLEFKVDDPNFQAGIECEIYALFYDADFEPAGVRKFVFNKPELTTNAPDAVVEIEVSSVTEKGATYTFTADENTLGFMYETLEADWFDEFSKTGEYYDTYIHELLFKQGYYWAYSGDLNDDRTGVFVESKGDSGARYYAAACPMNANGPREEGWGNLVLSEYTTK